MTSKRIRRKKKLIALYGLCLCVRKGMAIKKSYPNEAEAQSRIDVLVAEKIRDFDILNAYRCPEVENVWHIGHRPQKKGSNEADTQLEARAQG